MTQFVFYKDPLAPCSAKIGGGKKANSERLLQDKR